MSNNPDFGKMAKEVRTALNLEPSQFAQLLGVSQASVYSWENGSRQPEGPALRLIYTMKQRIADKQPGKVELEKVVEAIAVGAAALGLILLLGTLFAKEK